MTDALSVTLSKDRKLSRMQLAIITVVLMVATKICALPSVAAKAAGSKAIWVVLLLSTVDMVTLIFALMTARKGGLISLDIPKAVKIPVAAFFLLFFIVKVAVISREVATYFASSLFENVSVLPVAAILVAACCMGASKGFEGIARVAEIFMWTLLFVFLFAVVFTRSMEDAFNALAMFNGNFSGFGKGVLAALGWFGDTTLVAFMDLSGDAIVKSAAKSNNASEKKPKSKAGSEGTVNKNKGSRPNKLTALFKPLRTPLTAAGIGGLLLTAFFGVFIAVYGDLAKMTDYAFIKLSAFKSASSELGSADWPVIILWAIGSCFFIALAIEGAKESLRTISCIKENSKLRFAAYAVITVAAVVVGALLLGDKDRIEGFMKNCFSYVVIAACGLTIICGLISLKTGGKYEKS